MLWILAFGTFAGLLHVNYVLWLSYMYMSFLFFIHFFPIIFPILLLLNKHLHLVHFPIKNIIVLLLLLFIFGCFTNVDTFLHGFQIAIFPFYTEKDTALSVINCFGFCIIDYSSNESMVFTLIINLIKVINVYLLYQFVQAVRLNTRR